MIEETAPARGSETRNQIIQAAHDLFMKQGYHGTSMRQIAQLAQVALGGVYNHFSSKEEVFRTVFLDYHPFRQILPVLQNTPGDSVEAFVRNAITHTVEIMLERTDFLNLMFIELVEFKSIHTQQLFKEIYPQGLAIAQHLADMENGAIRAVPSPILVRTLVGTIMGYYISELILADKMPEASRQDALAYYIDTLLHGILA